MYTVILTMTIKQSKESSFPQHPMISWVIYPREVVLNDLLSTVLFETLERICKYSWTLTLLRQAMISLSVYAYLKRKDYGNKK